MREDLERDLIVALQDLIADGDMAKFKSKLTIVLSRYEVTASETALTVYQGDVNDQIMRKFLASKIAAGRSKKTVSYYQDTVRKFLASVGKPYNEVTADDIRLYMAKRLMNDGVSKTTVNNERRNISAFFAWLRTEEIITKNPMNKIEQFKVTKEKKQAFSPMDLEKIRAACLTNREKALVEFLASTWCRISEAMSVKIEDIKDDKLTVLGKGDKYRTVYLNARAQIAVKLYLSERSDGNPYLFPRAAYAGRISEFDKNREWYKNKDQVDSSRPMDVSSAESLIRKIGKRAGVENVHPHRFRRTGATMALRAGMPLTTVSKILGHENIGTTQIYLDISDEELQEAHNKYVR